MATGSASSRGQVAAVVLAAGRGERFGGAVPKPLALLQGRPLVAHTLDAALGSGLAPVLLVVGNGADEVATAARGAEVEVVVNDRWESGIASSLGAALAALRPRAGIGAALIGLADQPLVGAEAYRRLAAAYAAGAALAVATYDGRRRNPVLLARSLWEEALALTGDEGARALLRTHGAAEVPCDGTGDPLDIDTPETLAALEARWR